MRMSERYGRPRGEDLRTRWLVLSAAQWAVGRWYVYTPMLYADLQAGSAGVAWGRAWLVVEPWRWRWARIAPACIHACLALVLLFALAEPVIGQPERGSATAAGAQAGPSERNFTVVLPKSFVQARPGPMGAALPGETVVSAWRKLDSPLAVVVRAVALAPGTTLAQYVEMKRAARRSLDGYTEVSYASTVLSGQPAIDLEFVYRHPAGQAMRQRDVLVVFEQVGWAISWTHPEPVATALRAEGEAVVGSFRFRAPVAVVERPAPSGPQPTPTVPPASRSHVQSEAAPRAPEPASVASLVTLLAERGATVVSDRRVVHLSPGQVSTRYSVLVPPGTTRLAVAASWPGSVVELMLYRPDGEVAVVRRGEQPPLLVTIDAPMPGPWAYAVTAVDVPRSDYPVTLAAALTPMAAGEVSTVPRQQPAAVPAGLPRAGQPLPASWLAFLGVVLAESGLWLRRRTSSALPA